MLFGWKLFKYSKAIKGDADYKSHCNTNIFPYSQTLFRSQVDLLSIYTGSSKQIEVFFGDGSLEIRLSVWSLYTTTNIILEKFMVNHSEYRVSEKSICFQINKKKFIIDFFKKEDIQAFDEKLKLHENSNSSNIKMDMMLDYRNIEIKETVVSEFIKSIKAITPITKNDEFKIEVNSYDEFKKALRSLSLMK